MGLDEILDSIKDVWNTPKKRALLISFAISLGIQGALYPLQHQTKPQLSPEEYSSEEEPIRLSSNAITNSLQWKDRYLAVARNNTVLASWLNAIAATESAGDPSAGSDTGALGLFQITTTSGQGIQVPNLENFKKECSLAKNKKCYVLLTNKQGRAIPSYDNRTRPYPATYGGATILARKLAYIQKNCGKKARYKDQWMMAITAYNTGEGVVCEAAEASGQTPPTWHNTLSYITPRLINEKLGKNYGWNTRQIRRQTKDAQRFALKVHSYQQRLREHYK